jgi:hypothetical protein
VAQELLHFLSTQKLRVPLAVENYIAPNPVDISLFRSIAVVAKTNCFAHFVEEARGLLHDAGRSSALTG